MKELKFETGLVHYQFNGAVEVTFNPADREFAERFYNAFDMLGKIQDEYSGKAPKEVSVDVFAIARERDGKMEQIIDDLFGVPICAAVFGNMSVCAFADGFPVWMNLMLSVLDEIEENLGEVEKRANPRIAKYTAKYQKYQKHKNVVPME